MAVVALLRLLWVGIPAHTVLGSIGACRGCLALVRLLVLTRLLLRRLKLLLKWLVRLHSGTITRSTMSAKTRGYLSRRGFVISNAIAQTWGPWLGVRTTGGRRRAVGVGVGDTAALGLSLLICL